MAVSFTPRIDREPVVHPLFYDALSGEFMPPQDAQKRLHTLGRLAFAAFSKGTYRTQTGSDVIDMHSYNPSWAPRIDVELWCKPKYGDTALRNIYLTSPNRDELVISHDAEDEIVDGSKVVRNTICLEGNVSPTFTFNVVLGDELTIARAAITEAAQSFFDASARAISL